MYITSTFFIVTPVLLPWLLKNEYFVVHMMENNVWRVMNDPVRHCFPSYKVIQYKVLQNTSMKVSVSNDAKEC